MMASLIIRLTNTPAVADDETAKTKAISTTKSQDESAEFSENATVDPERLLYSRVFYFVRENLNDYPCSFNVGRANYNIDKKLFNRERVWPLLDMFINWSNVVSDVQVNSKDDSWAPLIWRQHLRVRAYVELKRLDDAKKLIDEILYKTGGQNITAMANLAVLHFVEGKKSDFQDVLRQLNEFSKLRSFRHLKADSLCEQAFIFYEYSGADNNISGIELLKFALKFWVKDKCEAALLLGTLYRRCLHWNTYEFDKDKIDFCDFAQKAYDILNTVRMNPEAKDTVKANALVELAFLKHEISSTVDIDLHGLAFEDSIEEMCKQAVSLAPASAKVTGIVGQLVRQSPHLRDWSKYLLELSIDIEPYPRAYHHLGLILLREAQDFELTNEPKHPSPERKLLTNKIQLPVNIEFILDSLLVEGERIQQYSRNNPYIQQATENLSNYYHCSSLAKNLPTAVRLGYTYIQCGAHPLAFEIFLKFNKYSIRDIPSSVLAYAHKMAALCLLLMAEAQIDEEEKRVMRQQSASGIIKAVGLFENISKQTAKDLEPKKIWEALANIPMYHAMQPKKFPRITTRTDTQHLADFFRRAVPVPPDKLKELLRKPTE